MSSITGPSGLKTRSLRSPEKLNRRSFVKRIAAASALVGSGGLWAFTGSSNYDLLGPTFGPRYSAAPDDPPPVGSQRKGNDSIHRWNQIAIDASGFDHAHAREQLGPCRASRALAIVHIAIFDTVNAVAEKYESYTGVVIPNNDVSLQAAISQAAHDTLVALFPSQALSFDMALAEDLAEVKDSKQKANGIDLGMEAAAAILRMRSDGSEIPEPAVGVDWFTSNLPGHWRQDPISLIPLALGATWSKCKPFLMQSASQFRVPPPPALTSAEYTAAYNEVKGLGGDGV